VHDRLAAHPGVREFGFRLTAFNGPSKVYRPARSANARAESHWRLRDLLEAGKVAIPDDPLLTEEHLAIQWRPDTQGRVLLESKDELRQRLGRSPTDSTARRWRATPMRGTRRARWAIKRPARHLGPCRTSASRCRKGAPGGPRRQPAT